MGPVKFRFVLFFLVFSAALSTASGDVRERENIAAALKQEAVIFTERTFELENGGTGGAVWAYIPSAEEEEDVSPSDGSSSMSALVKEYADIAGEISAGFVSSADAPVELPANSLILIIPLSGQPGENGLSWGAEMGLHFIREAGKQYRKQNIVVAFPDYEGAGGGGGMGALQDIYGSLDNPENSILLFLDFPAPPGELSVYHGSPGHIAPLGILKPLADFLDSRGVPYSFRNRFNELYKFSLIGEDPVMEFMQSRDIPSLLIRSIKSAGVLPPGGGESAGPPGLLPPGQLAGVLAEYSKEAAVETGNLDTHYSIYRIRGRTLFVSEILSIRLLLLALGGIIAVFLLFFLFRRLKMLIHLRTGFSYSWVSLLYGAALFLSAIAGEALLYAFAALFRVQLSALPLDRLYTVICLAFLAGILLFCAVPSPLLSLIWIKRRGGFYGFSAICFSIVLLLSGSMLDITAAPLLTWMLICISLAMIWPHAAPAFIFSLVLTVAPVITFADAFGNRELCRLFLSNFALSALTVTLFAFPLLLSLMRAITFAVPYRIRKKPVLVFARLGLFALCTIILAVYLGSL
ncbi:MAG: hypothetical protein LBL20_06860 [Treponema sp.]|jgi:hypothetical protein|nr:hypothetical protein [Treponema sp.]